MAGEETEAETAMEREVAGTKGERWGAQREQPRTRLLSKRRFTAPVESTCGGAGWGSWRWEERERCVPGQLSLCSRADWAALGAEKERAQSERARRGGGDKGREGRGKAGGVAGDVWRVGALARVAWAAARRAARADGTIVIQDEGRTNFI